MGQSVNPDNPVFGLAEHIFNASRMSEEEYDLRTFPHFISTSYWNDNSYFWVGQNRLAQNWVDEYASKLTHETGRSISEKNIREVNQYIVSQGKIERARCYILAELNFEAAKRYNENTELIRTCGFMLIKRSLGIIFPEAVLKVIDTLLPILKTNCSREEEVLLYSWQAKAHRYMCSYDLATKYYELAKQKAEEIEDENLVAYQIYMLGKMYCNYNQHPEEGLACYNKALQIYRKIGDKKFEAACLDDIGNFYSHYIEDFELAKKYFNDALAINRKMDNDAGISRNLCHLAMLYFSNRKFDDAKKMLLGGIEILEQNVEQRRGLGIRYGQLALMYLKEKNIDKAFDLMAKALFINREFNDRPYAAKNLLNLAEIYFVQEKFKEELVILNKVLEICHDNRSGNEYSRYPDLEMECYNKLGALYHKAGNYKKAYESYLIAQDLITKVRKSLIENEPSKKKEKITREVVQIYHFLLKQYNNKLQEFNRIIRSTLELYHKELSGEKEPDLKARLAKEYNIQNIVGRSEKLLTQLEYGLRAAKTNEPVLLLGETGVGKEVFALAIHLNSERKCHNRTPEESFLAVNCGAIPKDLIESELFGHVKGAFTHATSDKKGLIEVVDGGTIFLDEIADMPLNAQVKLHRFLQEREIRKVGSLDVQLVDVRVIAATNKNLEEEIEKGNFREDLFYRLNVIPIQIPSLRERPEDIDALIDYILAKKLGDGEKPTFSEDAILQLKKYAWKGNVRELESIIARCIRVIDEDNHIDGDDVHKAIHLLPLRSKKMSGDFKQPEYAQCIELDGFASLGIREIPQEGINFHELLREFAEKMLQIFCEHNKWSSLKQISQITNIPYDKMKHIIRKKERRIIINRVNISDKKPQNGRE
ncbi:tetratricopeptide repeat protein [candidate division KSB1 bacterium]|nr:tetratricopeptide repeat protein [candidate division KSB1 bacterium]